MAIQIQIILNLGGVGVIFLLGIFFIFLSTTFNYNTIVLCTLVFLENGIAPQIFDPIMRTLVRLKNVDNNIYKI